MRRLIAAAVILGMTGCEPLNVSYYRQGRLDFANKLLMDQMQADKERKDEEMRLQVALMWKAVQRWTTCQDLKKP